MPFDYAISAFLTLFVVVDPNGLTPTFVAVADRLPRPRRLGLDRRLAPRDAANFARRLPDRRRPAFVFNRLGNGLWRPHSAGRRSRRAGGRGACAQHRRVSARNSADGGPWRN